MATDEMTLPNLAGLEKHPVKSILMALILGFGSIWAFYRPALIADLSLDFVPVAVAQSAHEEITEEVALARKVMSSRMDTLEGKIDENSYAVQSLQTEFRLTAAFQLEHSIKMDLEKHENQTVDQRDANWSNDVSKLKRRLSLSTQYKNCILNEDLNCDLLQRQLYQ